LILGALATVNALYSVENLRRFLESFDKTNVKQHPYREYKPIEPTHRGRLITREKFL